MFNIVVDKAYAVVQVRLGGMLSAPEVGAYITELKNKLRTSHLREYRLIVDASECPIQHQDVIMLFAQHMGSMPKAQAIAIITGSSLIKMQVKRIFTQPYARIVASAAEARAWVLSGTEPGSA